MGGGVSSPTGVGSRRRVFEVLWNSVADPFGEGGGGGLGMKREICAHFNEGILAQFGRMYAQDRKIWTVRQKNK